MFTGGCMENKVISIKDQQLNKSTLSREDIWGSDLLNYRKEIYQMGNTIMLFSGIMMALNFALSSAFEFPVSAVSGMSFFIFVLGLGVSLRPFFGLLDSLIGSRS